ncbi:unnamed protein product, partial [Chrysoparadoxa australica]
MCCAVLLAFQAFPFLAIAQQMAPDSAERAEWESKAYECIQEAYRYSWGMPATRNCLSVGSHIMIIARQDKGLPVPATLASHNSSSSDKQHWAHAADIYTRRTLD